MATQSSSSCVYVRDEEHGWLPANVLSYEGGVAKVAVSTPSGGKVDRDVDVAEYEGGSLPLQNVDEGGHLMELADMCDLPSLHEAAILYNLKARHLQKKPYTRVGDIIIAVNPFQWIEGLYADETRELYVDKLVWNAGIDGDSRVGLDPHVYETSSLAYRGLAIDGHHQSILVSGESGAGKTETVKIVMSHLASVQSTAFIEEVKPADHISHDPRGESAVVRRVLDSNPLLEAFGNAKTVRNDNSSRFGKYIQLQFDVEDATSAAFKGKEVPSCILAGSVCETYLLEKSRVVGHEAKERTYHIFYQLLAAPDETKTEIWDGLVGADNSSFAYVGETDTLRIEGRTDGEKWRRTVDALAVADVAGDRLRTLMRAVCTVMQLGNLTFDVDPSDDEKCVITSEDELAKLVDLMGVEADDVKRALLARTITAGKETYKVPLKADAARDSRNAFAKEIYQQVFDWLVRTINNATSAEVNYGDASDVDEFGIIGLLDIFGFESFEVNRYEQLCINYANEKLQQKYTVDIFSSVQEEYEYEGIELGEVAFSDNADVLNLVEGRLGLLAVLNEECVRPNGNDTSFVSKVKTMNKEVSCLICESLYRPTEFAILHYAGVVKYDATSFVEKNQDKLPNDLLECACKSTNDLIKTELKAAADAKAAAPMKARGKKASSLTVSTKFRAQLGVLMHNLGATRTRYIRCIKPNPEKRPMELNLRSSNDQLRCAGVISAVKVTRSAFPNRLMHETALERFRCLSSDEVRHDMDEKKDDSDSSGLKASVESLMEELLKEREQEGEDGALTKAYCCGKSRVYFRSGALEHLESARLKALGVLATAIERMARGFTARSKFLRLKATAISCQAMARRTLARKAFLRAKAAETTISCWIRCIFAKVELVRRQREKACIMIQTRGRILLAQNMFLQCRSSAVLIQKIARGAIQRPIYRRMLKEAEEEARVNSKIAALQKRLADAEMKWIQADKQRIEAEKRAAVGGGAPTLGAPETVSEVGEEKKDDEKALMDESVEMIEFLRKEVFTLRSKNYLLRADLAEVKQAYQELAAHSSSVTSSHEALKQNMVHLTEQNKALSFKANADKREFLDAKKALNTSRFTYQSELSALRQEIKAKDAAHDTEVARLKKIIEDMQNGALVQEEPTAPAPEPEPQTSITRAAFNLSSAYFPRLESSELDEPEAWGSDGYYELYGRGRNRGDYRRSRRGKWPAQQKRHFVPTRPSSQRSSLAKRAGTAATSLAVASAAPASSSSLSAAASGVRTVSSGSSLSGAARGLPNVPSKPTYLTTASKGLPPSAPPKSSLAAATGTSLAASTGTSLAAAKGTSLAAAKGTSLAATKGTSLAAAKGTSLAAAKGTSLAAATAKKGGTKGSSSLSAAAGKKSSLASRAATSRT